MKRTPENDETTGLPRLRSWRAIYLLVLILFAIEIALLILLERNFS